MTRQRSLQEDMLHTSQRVTGCPEMGAVGCVRANGTREAKNFIYSSFCFHSAHENTNCEIG